jgi:hypothetical protein
MVHLAVANAARKMTNVAGKSLIVIAMPAKGSDAPLSGLGGRMS